MSGKEPLFRPFSTWCLCRPRDIPIHRSSVFSHFFSISNAVFWISLRYSIGQAPCTASHSSALSVSFRWLFLKTILVAILTSKGIWRGFSTLKTNFELWPLFAPVGLATLAACYKLVDKAMASDVRLAANQGRIDNWEDRHVSAQATEKVKSTPVWKMRSV
jgi:hypothetical protein